MSWLIGLSATIEQLGQVLDDHISSVLAQSVGLVCAIHTHDVPEIAGPTRLHSGQRVLEDRSGHWLDPHCLRAGEEGVRRGLAMQMPFADHHTVDACLDETLQVGRLQHRLAVG